MTRSSNRLPWILSVVALFSLATAVVVRPPALPAGGAAFPPAPVADPQRRSAPGLTYALDGAQIAGQQIGFVNSRARIVVHPGQIVDVSGWALDPRTMLPAQALEAEVDGAARRFDAQYGTFRPDVARVLADPDAAASGFEVAITFAGVGLGAHVIHFAVVGKDGRVLVLPSSVAVTVD